MGEFSLWHMLILFGVVLIFFGPSRLPGLGNSLGKAIKGFKEGIKGEDSNEEKEAKAAREALEASKKDDVASKKSKKSNDA